MKTATTRTQYSEVVPTLYVAFELSWSEWKLAFTVGLGQRPRLRTIAAGDLETLSKEILRAKARFGLAESARVVSCYEAGRDGFWLHRFLVAQGVESHVVDASSIEVPRRKRRAKTDRLDATKLVAMLVRYDHGERRVWSVVRVPTVEQEDQRHLHRELDTLKKERTRQSNRIKGLLAGLGLRLPVGKGFLERLEQVRLWDGSPVPEGLRFRLQGEFERLEFIEGQVEELEEERRRLMKESQEVGAEKARCLAQLKAIGENSAWMFSMELFAWRTFRNRKQVGALVGFAPTPFDSGESSREQGISKAGNPRLRSMAIQIAWGWLRFQPRSQLTLWYQERFAHGGSRLRKVGIVAVARRLLIALWRFVEFGIVPDGAELKA